MKFGSRVTILRGDGVDTNYRIVDSDEADPKTGSVSYVSPLSQAIRGKSAGEVFTIASREFTIVCVN